MNNFWGLFLIVGAVAITVLLVYFVIFLYKEKHTLRRTANESSNLSIGNKIRALLKIYDERDLTSHTFRKGNPPKVVDNKIYPIHDDSVGISPNSNYPSSPSNYSIHDMIYESSEFVDLSSSNQIVEMVIHTITEVTPENEE